MKVVIFDHKTSDVGHYKYFNKHIIKLLDSENVEIYMADYARYFKRWYYNLNLEKAQLKIIDVSEHVPPLRKIESQIKNPIKSMYFYEKEKKWYRDISKKINSLHPDVVILTSQGSPALYKIFDVNGTPIVMITHTAKEFLDSTWKKENGLFRLKLKKRVKLAQRFLNKLSSVVVLEEKTSKYLNNIGIKSFWIPYMLFSSEKQKEDERNLAIPNNKKFLISTVGIIYKGKNIEFVLNSLKKNRTVNFKYRIAGLPKEKYGQYIKRMAMEFSNEIVECRFEYLSDEDYAEEIKKSNFIVIPYVKARSDQASGVFFDALRYNRPVITPDIDPFKNYIDKYKVGLTYKEGDYESFINAVNLSMKLGTEHFLDNILKFKEDFSYKKWKSRIQDFLKSLI